jgi:hypothetical protein
MRKSLNFSGMHLSAGQNVLFKVETFLSGHNFSVWSKLFSGQNFFLVSQLFSWVKTFLLVQNFILGQNFYLRSKLPFTILTYVNEHLLRWVQNRMGLLCPSRRAFSSIRGRHPDDVVDLPVAQLRARSGQAHDLPGQGGALDEEVPLAIHVSRVVKLRGI